MPYHSSLAIANEFLRRADAEGRPLSNMQLQKLVYLAHGWNLAVNGDPLIEDSFEAWDFGPVARRLYSALRKYGSGQVTDRLRWGDDTNFPGDDAGLATADLTHDEVAVIDRVWETYGAFPAFKLSALTHSERSPWQHYYRRGRNQVIDNNRIYDYFAELADQ